MADVIVETFEIEAIFGAKTHQGLVLIKWGDKQIAVPPAEARAYAHLIFEAAEAAEQDEFIVTFMTEKAGAPFEAALRVLQDFRQHRQKKVN